MEQLTVDKGQLRIYPNPTTGLLDIDFPGMDDLTEIKVYDVVGQLKMDVKNVRQIDISDFSAGVYILVIKNNKESWMNKITKL
jgi:hypothetical protein